MITCTRCLVEKPESHFYNRKDTRSGKAERCKSCVDIKNKEWELKHPGYQRGYTNTRRKKTKEGIIKTMGGCCAHCGLIDNPIVYDIHHVIPTEKEYTLGQILDHSPEKIKKEIEKCILLCAHCHRKEHERMRSSKSEVGAGPNMKDLQEVLDF